MLIVFDGLSAEFPVVQIHASLPSPSHAYLSYFAITYVKLTNVGSRAFPAAASSIWNSLPEYIVSASTLQSFQLHLKTFLFRRSFPDILL